MAEPLTLTALGAAALWLVDKATGGVVSDYTKKFIRKTLLGLKDESEALRLELQKSRDRFDSITQGVNDLLEIKDALEAEVIRLRVENEKLKAKLTQAEKQPPSDRR